MYIYVFIYYRSLGKEVGELRKEIGELKKEVGELRVQSINKD